MIDREKVIKGLECLANENAGCHSDCPYYENHMSAICFRAMARDALTLLQEQNEIDATIEPCKSCQEWNCHSCEWLKRIEGW